MPDSIYKKKEKKKIVDCSINKRTCLKEVREINPKYKAVIKNPDSVEIHKDSLV